MQDCQVVVGRGSVIYAYSYRDYYSITDNISGVPVFIQWLTTCFLNMPNAPIPMPHIESTKKLAYFGVLFKIAIITEDTSESDQIKTIIMTSESKIVISTLNKCFSSLLCKQIICFACIFC